ncbi:MAG: hypothetical protein H6680_04935 [Desulfobacteraceae bacterium]|nr:hypothetical protein [Desulfobacteraceae bacterium]
MGIKTFFSFSAGFILILLFFIYFAGFYNFNNDFEIKRTKSAQIINDEELNSAKKNADNQNNKIISSMNNKRINKKNESSLIEPDNLIELFKLITAKFKDSINMSSHFEDVYNYLEKNYDKDTADFIFSNYSEFVKCSEELSVKLSLLPMPVNKNEILERIDYVEEFRKEYLGEELYNALYKDEAKIKKYRIEVNSVIHDKDLYAYEKKALLQEIKDKYNLEEKIKSSYEKYMEALLINQKDMSELDKDQYEYRKQELKKEYFTEDMLEKRKNIEDEMNLYDKAVTDFNEKKQVLLENGALTKEEKDIEIANLKNQIFTKNQLERFERTEKIKYERKKLIEKYGLD